jgi:hypothetical protein
MISLFRHTALSETPDIVFPAPRSRLLNGELCGTFNGSAYGTDIFLSTWSTSLPSESLCVQFLITIHPPLYLDRTKNSRLARLVGVQQSDIRVLPLHLLVLHLQPDPHDPHTNNDSNDESGISYHGHQVPRTIGFRIEVRSVDERSHRDGIDNRQCCGLLFGCLTTGS